MVDPINLPDAVYRFSMIKNPSDVFTFIDEHPDSIEDGNFGLERPPKALWLNLPADRHNQGACSAFVDGHVRKYKWLAPKVYKSLNQVPASTLDLRDLQTLQLGLPNPP